MLFRNIENFVFEIKFYFLWRENRCICKHRKIVGFERQFHVLLIIGVLHRFIQIMHFDETENGGVLIPKLVRNIVFDEIGQLENLSDFRKRKQINA